MTIMMTAMRMKTIKAVVASWRRRWGTSNHGIEEKKKVYKQTKLNQQLRRERKNKRNNNMMWNIVKSLAMGQNTTAISSHQSKMFVVRVKYCPTLTRNWTPKISTHTHTRTETSKKMNGNGSFYSSFVKGIKYKGARWVVVVVIVK